MADMQDHTLPQSPTRRVGLPSSPREFLLFPPSQSATLHPPSPTHLSPATFKCPTCGTVRRPFHSPSSSTSTARTVVGSPSLSLKVDDAETVPLWEQPRQPPPTPRLPQAPLLPQVTPRNEQQHERKGGSSWFGSCFGRQNKKSKQPRWKQQREPLYLVEDLHWTER